MNPNVTIRPWLLACGLQVGIRYVHEYRWHDADNKPDMPYCTYRIMSSIPENEGVHYLTTASINTAVERAAQPWLTTVRVDLFNSQNGLYELASFCVAQESHPSIKELFRQNATMVERSVEDLTEADDEELVYHHRLTAVFRENVEHTLEESNGVVDTIRLQLDDGTFFDQYDIDDTGFTPTT
jgi:hypothetical protein